MKFLKTKDPYSLIVTSGAAVGLIASFWQATERIHMLKYPAQPLSCNLSPVVDCGGVLGNKAAAVFGPPNAFIGMVAFTLLLAFGLQRLSGGQWTLLVRRIVLVLSIVMFMFSIWFFITSVYSIGKICIFCVFIWIVSVPLAVYGVKEYYEQKPRLSKYLKVIIRFIACNHLAVTTYIYLGLITAFFLHFREYYF